MFQQSPVHSLNTYVYCASAHVAVAVTVHVHTVNVFHDVVMCDQYTATISNGFIIQYHVGLIVNETV